MCSLALADHDRLIWAVLVLGATGFFIWFMTDRLLFLLDNPKAVDVEVIYTDTVDFPAVTICNQNLFRYKKSITCAIFGIV